MKYWKSTVIEKLKNLKKKNVSGPHSSSYLGQVSYYQKAPLKSPWFLLVEAKKGIVVFLIPFFQGRKSDVERGQDMCPGSPLLLGFPY